MQAMQQFCLRWNNHQPNFISVFTTLLNDEALVDVTLACEGKHLQAHRVVLSACSAYFQSLFTINPCQHPIVILKDIKFSDLKTMVDFMYYGEVNVSQDQLPAILKIAEMLKIKGLADIPDMRKQTALDKDLLTPGDTNWARSSSPMSPAMRRKRLRKSSTGSGSGSTEQTSEEIVAESISGHSPSVKVEHVDVEDGRSYSRQSLRNSHQEPSTDSEPKEGSQDSGTEEYSARHDRQPSRQLSNESRQLSYENRQMSTDSRQGSYEMRQLSHDSRHSSFDGRQTSHETRQISHDSRQASHESRQLSFEGRQLSFEGRQLSHEEGRQASHDSKQMSLEKRLSHESSIESVGGDAEASSSNLLPSVTHGKVGTKRGRLLMRQQRIKKENDTHTSPDSDPGSPSYPNLLSVSSAKMERQRSEPTPSSHSSPPPTHCSTSTSNLLTVPQPTFTVRQHSTQSPPPFPVAAVLVRQVSQPPPLTAVQVKSVQTSDDASRSASPSVVMESLPIVRIIAEAADPDKKNSYSYRSRSEEMKRTSVQSVSEMSVPETCRSVHCPVLRTGPALGCNYCWNTIDAHGRILRRKTKYHCPECQTNLCIVPCFQDYHRRQVELPTKPEQPSVS